MQVSVTFKKWDATHCPFFVIVYSFIKESRTFLRRTKCQMCGDAGVVFEC